MLDMAVLVLAPNAWQGHWVNRQQLFSRLGRQCRVLYSTGSWSTWQRHEAAWRAAPLGGAMLPMDNVTVDQAPRLLMRNARWPWWDAAMLALTAARWRRWLAPRRGQPLVAYVYHPQFLPYVRHLRPDFLVYHAYDRYEHTPGWDAGQEAAERILLAQADLVLASSDQIADALRAKCRREVRVLPNGADVAAFARARSKPQPPPDVQAIPAPRLGWTGALHSKVDFALLAELAARRPDWHIVLLGHLNLHNVQAWRGDLEACQARPNVHFLGSRTAAEVPDYVVQMDVNMMAYKMDSCGWVSSGYPLKLHEYLAAGRPVVSVDLPSVRPFASVLSIAHGVDEWEAALAQALAEPDADAATQRRLAVAAQNGWDSRVEVLAAWLRQMVQAAEPLPRTQECAD